MATERGGGYFEIEIDTSLREELHARRRTQGLGLAGELRPQPLMYAKKIRLPGIVGLPGALITKAAQLPLSEVATKLAKPHFNLRMIP